MYGRGSQLCKVVPTNLLLGKSATETSHTVTLTHLPQAKMSKKVLETDFPLMAPPNPPLSVHPRFTEHGRNGSLRRAYSSEEVAPLHSPSSSETSDYVSDSQDPPQYLLHAGDPHEQLKHPPFRPPTHR